MNSRSSVRRPGYALVEMVVVIAVSSVIGVAAAMLLGSLLAADRGGRRHLQESNALGALARQFREDAAAADRVEIVPSAGAAENQERAGAKLKFSADAGQTVLYIGEPGRIVRKCEHESALRQESYALPEAVAAQFEIEPGSSPPFVRLNLSLAGAGSSGSRIEASVGRDRRRAAALARRLAPGQAEPEDRP